MHVIYMLINMMIGDLKQQRSFTRNLWLKNMNQAVTSDKVLTLKFSQPLVVSIQFLVTISDIIFTLRILNFQIASWLSQNTS